MAFDFTERKEPQKERNSRNWVLRRRKMERKRSSDKIQITEMKKGPWTAEEDEILMNYVKEYGPTGWSSIPSMGLLPRTGKSCRLRWVNKLRPNLKTGCKFSAEEERTVIELQAEFGNKWAKIATYLEGRTDNDVKNFWSARQKRHQRTPHGPTPTPAKSSDCRSKAKPVHPITMLPPEATLGSYVTVLEERTSEGKNLNQHPQSLPCVGNPEQWKMVALPDLVQPDLADMGRADIPPAPMMPSTSSECPFSQLPQPQLDLPFFLPPEPTPSYLLQVKQEPLMTAPPELGLLGTTGTIKDDVVQSSARTVSFLDDLPADMLDFFDSVPSSSEW